MSEVSLVQTTSLCGLLPLLAVGSVLCYKNLYCSYICAFGFMQRITKKIKLKKRYSLPSILKPGKYILLVIAIISFFIGTKLYLEPFSLIFSFKTNWWLYIFPAAMLAISLFIPHFWCRAFCPVGALMNIMRGIRRWILKQKTPYHQLRISSTKQAVLLAFITLGIILLSNILLFIY